MAMKMILDNVSSSLDAINHQKTTIVLMGQELKVDKSKEYSENWKVNYCFFKDEIILKILVVVVPFFI